MTALRWCGLACRAAALAAALYIIATGWQPLLRVVERHDLRISIVVAPLAPPIIAGPRRT